MKKHAILFAMCSVHAFVGVGRDQAVDETETDVYAIKNVWQANSRLCTFSMRKNWENVDAFYVDF